ncbi:hypothetical protein [Lentzea flava]|uniref:hypothetical protein n=1 Tax=Lentzea flava TaxID=103732 RepID=UPI00166F74C5|nr:hypothetical protein [Lentzea flava]
MDLLHHPQDGVAALEVGGAEHRPLITSAEGALDRRFADQARVPGVPLIHPVVAGHGAAQGQRPVPPTGTIVLGDGKFAQTSSWTPDLTNLDVVDNLVKDTVTLAGQLAFGRVRPGNGLSTPSLVLHGE